MKLKFLCAQPDEDYYIWQVHMWIESLKELGHSDKAIVLLFTPNFRERNNNWKQLIDLYPEVEFVFYDDLDNVSQHLGTYVSVIRPYVLQKYYTEHPELKDQAVFYCDADVIFTPGFSLDQFLDDDIIYTSDTRDYIGIEHFDSRIANVLPDKLDKYKKHDILSEVAAICGISKEIVVKNNSNAGGAQYLLKNIDASFWTKVLYDSLKIRLVLQNVNQTYFKDEDSGYLSWCADMWAVLWNLWHRNQEVKIVPELRFLWPYSLVKELDKAFIVHNIGVPGCDFPAFNKKKYQPSSDPLKDPYLEVILNDEVSKQYCTHYYVSKLVELKDKYKLDY